MILSYFFPSSLTLFPLFSLIFIIFATTLLLLRRKQPKHDRKLPPGPRGYPIIGNLHMLGKLPHHTLETLSKKYGPIMTLRLGQIPTIIVSSSSAAEQLKTHDMIFASRAKTEASDYLSYEEYGAYWRNMRKVCTSQLLNTSKVESFAPLRKKEVHLALKSIKKSASLGEVVDLRELVHNVVMELIYKMVLGCSKDDEFDLKGLLQEITILHGTFNLADYVPFLGAFDLQGLKRRFNRSKKEIDQVLEKIINEHKQSSHVENEGQEQKDFIDILLSLMQQPIDFNDEQNHVIDRTNIKAICLDMISGAFDTTSASVVWVFSELMRHPKVMKNLQQELDDVVGLNKLVEESDLEKLNYLNIVIKETLRLHPPGPLIPRESLEDVVINGYFIKKNSRIIMNLRTIGRDPKTWSNNAEEFYPERFIDKDLDYHGNEFHYTPFGFGRRGCPGMNLALANLKLLVAQLVHCFSWKLPSNMNPNDLDMTEIFGLSVPRAKPLLVFPTYRLSEKAI